MKVSGRVLTEEEAARVRKHFVRNNGEKWTLAKIKKYVDIGAEKISENAEIRSAIERGMDKVCQG